RYAQFIKRVHERAKGGTLRTALSISGGGIRSATYALGVLQGLARRHVLEKFDFLSTISGGGYIGGWLSSWARRDPWGMRGVSALLSQKPHNPLDTEPLPLRHLRAYSSYLIPRLSLFSADTWALVATYLRNVLLNWIVLIPLLAGVLAVPRVLLSAVKLDSRIVNQTNALYGFIIGLVLLIFGFGALIRYRPVIHSKATRTLNDGKFVKWILLPLLAAATTFMLAWAWNYTAGGGDIGLPGFLGAAMLATTSAFFVFFWRFVRWPFVDRPKDAKAREKRTSGRLLAELGGSVASGVIGGILYWFWAAQVFPEPVEPIDPISVLRWPIMNTGKLVDITAAYVVFGVPLLLFIFFLQAVIFVGASSHHNHDFDREWWARASGWVLLAALGWIGLSAIAIYGPVAIYHIPGILSAVGGGAGIFSLLAGRSGNTQGTSEEGAQPTTTSKALSLGLAIAVPIFVIYILALISLGTTELLSGLLGTPTVSSQEIGRDTRYAQNSTREYTALVAGKPAKVKETPLANSENVRAYEHLKLVESTPWYLALAIALGCPLLAIIISRCIGVNVFSMHAMYRNRLVRAYLGASRWSRSPNEFTGFDPQDNLEMHDLRPEYLWWHNFRDIDNAIGLVANGRTPRLKLIATELRHELGDELDRLLDPETPRAIARPAFYQALNVLIATRDLAHLSDPKGIKPMPEPGRALRTRRFIEVAFSDSQVYPSPMPTICVQDIRPGAPFVATFAKGASPAADTLRELYKQPGVEDSEGIREQLNDVITEAPLSEIPPFSNATIDPRIFRFSDIDP
ncbi:MAG TPA: patatin-like phospholipase family protein, partial [Thermoanaerobaculia bacterium]|nr:patatin-like phospholipase family protein [Thermoanaerobaculia bacterium]